MEVAGMAGAQQWQEWPNMWSGVLVGWTGLIYSGLKALPRI